MSVSAGTWPARPTPSRRRSASAETGPRTEPLRPVRAPTCTESAVATRARAWDSPGLVVVPAAMMPMPVSSRSSVRLKSIAAFGLGGRALRQRELEVVVDRGGVAEDRREQVVVLLLLLLELRGEGLGGALVRRAGREPGRVPGEGEALAGRDQPHVRPILIVVGQGARGQRPRRRRRHHEPLRQRAGGTCPDSALASTSPRSRLARSQSQTTGRSAVARIVYGPRMKLSARNQIPAKVTADHPRRGHRQRPARRRRHAARRVDHGRGRERARPEGRQRGRGRHQGLRRHGRPGRLTTGDAVPRARGERLPDRRVGGRSASWPAARRTASPSAGAWPRPGDVGRIWSLSRPLAYRALDVLQAQGLIEPLRSEPGAGPHRTILRADRRGAPPPRTSGSPGRWSTSATCARELLLKLVAVRPERHRPAPAAAGPARRRSSRSSRRCSRRRRRAGVRPGAGLAGGVGAGRGPVPRPDARGPRDRRYAASAAASGSTLSSIRNSQLVRRQVLEHPRDHRVGGVAIGQSAAATASRNVAM